MGAGAPRGNKNAEKWTHEASEELFQKALKLAENPDYDFIGEIASELHTNKSTFTELAAKFPDLAHYYTSIRERCEANCYRNGKLNKINTAMAIVNLKSNHGWTDRTSNEISGRLEIEQITGIEVK